MTAELTTPAAGGERFSDEAIASMRAQPSFTQAMRAATIRTLEHCGQNRSMARISRDSGQFLLAMLSLYLHVTGGVTIGRLQALCVEANLCSPGRAVAILVQLRLLGFVRPLAQAGDQRMRRYAPTPDMNDAFHTWLRDLLEATALVDADASAARARFDEPVVFASIVRTFGEGVLAAAKVYQPKSPSLAVISGRAGGMLILYHLLLQGEEADGFPPQGSVRASAHELSRRFGVSRQHVMRVLGEAEAIGYLQRDSARSQCVIQPPLREEIELYFAIMFLSAGHCARHALRAGEERDGRLVRFAGP